VEESEASEWRERRTHERDKLLADVGHEGVEGADEARVVRQDVLAVPAHRAERLQVSQHQS